MTGSRLVAPNVSRIAFLADLTSTGRYRQIRHAAEGAARSLGMQLHVQEVHNPDELSSALLITSTSRQGAGAALVDATTMLYANRTHVADQAQKSRLPTMCGVRDHVTLLLPTCWRRATTSATVQELLGHHDVSPTMIYTHVLNRGPAGVQSPDVPVMRLGLPQRYQISERDIPQRLVVYHRPRGRAAFARWRRFRHLLGAGGPFPVIYRPTQSCNAVQVTSRSPNGATAGV